jgi:hypothetical protein
MLLHVASLLFILPFAYGTAILKLPIKKLPRTHIDFSIETAHLTYKYGGQSTSGSSVFGAGGSGRRLRTTYGGGDGMMRVFNTHYDSDDYSYDAQDAHKIPLTSRYLM